MVNKFRRSLRHASRSYLLKTQHIFHEMRLSCVSEFSYISRNIPTSSESSNISTGFHLCYNFLQKKILLGQNFRGKTKIY